MSNPLWRPEKTRADQTTLGVFSAWMASRAGKSFADYDELHRYSISDPAGFWSSFWDFAEVIGDKGKPPYLVDADKMPGARFFPDAKLNFAENLLRQKGAGPALIFRGEDKVARQMSHDELRGEVARAGAALREFGVEAGDRVAAIMPNMPESIAAMLAAASIGAVWSSCSPDFGVQGVLDRFGQIEPKVLIACDGYYYAGKQIDISDKLAAIVAKLPTLRAVIVVRYLGTRRCRGAGPRGQPRFTRAPKRRPGAMPSRTARISRCASSACRSRIRSMCCSRRERPECPSASCIRRAARCSSISPSSCCTPTSGPGDRLFYFTTLGWMMWNWLVSGLASGATLLLYDGSPFHPTGNVLWDYAQSERATHFGTSAKYIDAMKKAEMAPIKTHDLSSVRALLSTGSPLVPEAFDYIYQVDQAGPASRVDLGRHRYLRLLRARHSHQARVARRDPRSRSWTGDGRGR